MRRCTAWAGDRGDAWLERVGLVDKADTRVNDLSGGQAQRLSIACALVHDPDLVFLDEPTAALDPQARRNLWDLLSGLTDSGRTVVLTTHYMDEAEALCDRVAIMDARPDPRARHAPPGWCAASTPRPGSPSPPARSPSRRRGASPASTRCVDSADGIVLVTRDAPPVVARLAEEGRLDGVQVHTGTLEDVFLSLTGRAYRA